MSATAYAGRTASARGAGLFGRVMALVAVTVGFATLGVWIAREWGGAGWFIAWLLSFGCLVGLSVANSRGQTGLVLDVPNVLLLFLRLFGSSS